MAEAQNDTASSEGVRKQVLRAITTIILGWIVWITYTVHQHSVDLAVIKSQLNRIETYWTQDE